MKRLSSILATSSLFVLAGSALAPVIGLEITTKGALINSLFFLASFLMAGYFHQSEDSYFNQTVFTMLISSFVSALVSMSVIILVITTFYTIIGTADLTTNYAIMLLSTLFGSAGFLYFYAK
jgi:hypothetical protein